MLWTVVRSFKYASSFITTSFSPSVSVVRGRHVWLQPYLRSLYKRRIDQGPEPERPRSVWINWNYDAEIYAFGKRLGEEFKSATLKQAFITSSYIEKENETRAKLGLTDNALSVQLVGNNELLQSGEVLATKYIIKYLQYCFPLLPDACVRSVTSHLMSVSTLSHIGLNLGIKDLIQTAEFPVSDETLCSVFKAVIGALAHDQGQQRAELFVQDFILPQLIGKDILELCAIKNPMALLTDILRQKGQMEPEPRLLWSSGKETILSSYIVGIYCNRQLIGQAPGETASIGEEMAARDALRRLLNIAQNCTVLPLGSRGHKLQLSAAK